MNETIASRPQPPAAEQRHQRPVVVVTGNNGLLGTALMRRCADRYQIVGFDRDGQPQPPPQVECVCVDLTEDHSVELGVQRTVYAYGARIAAVVHLAAHYDFSGEPSDLYEQVNVRGTERLLAALRAAGCDVGVFVHTSTMLVHRPTAPGEKIDEAAPLEAKWDYPRSKLRTERLLGERAGDLRVAVLRIAGVYTDACDSIPLAQQMHRIDARQLESRVFPGDADHGQAFVHLDDVVDAIERVIDRRADLPAGVTPLLIGEPETYGYRDLQRRFARLLHGAESWPVWKIPKGVAKFGAWLKDRLPTQQFIKPWMVDLADDHYELDVTRAREVLDWRPRHRLVDVLPKMTEAMGSDPKAWRARHGLPTG